MIHVSIRVCGDHWHNTDEVRAQLANVEPGDQLLLDVWNEGPSLTALGVVDAVMATGVDPKKVTVTRWENVVDAVPFRRGEPPRISHFFRMSETYYRPVDAATGEFQYAMFCGRKSWSRCGMIYDAYHALGNRCLFSVMPDSVPLPWQVPQTGIDLDRDQGWISHAAMEWWEHQPIASIDGRSMQDHLECLSNTNQSILDHYDRFAIEIVMETFCRAPAFLPTEKTVRPIMAGRALLLYGPRGFLARLRSLGFRTWHDCWNESYDDLEGPARWQAILALARQDLEPDTEITLHNQKVLEGLIS